MLFIFSMSFSVCFNVFGMKLCKKYDAYLELAHSVALLLCRALKVQLREPVMAAEAALSVASIPERRGVSLRTRKQCDVCIII